jgi:hypothetical protein
LEHKSNVTEAFSASIIREEEEAQMVSETLDLCSMLMWLVAREDLITLLVLVIICLQGILSLM